MTAQAERRMGPEAGSAGSSPFGLSRIWRQVKWDLFQTKDVQDAVTASYVWLEDEAGHIGLGFAFTITLCWIVSLFWTHASPARSIVFTALGAALIGVFAYKELRDRQQCKERWGHVFGFDSRDLDWNVETATFAFALGAAFAVTAFVFGWPGPAWTLAAALAVILPTAYWWLKHKVAFQQAGLPYLFRLANFDSKLDVGSIELLSAFAGYRNRRTSLKDVLLGRDPEPPREPEFQHILITGDLGAGKTSLCVGIGTEFSLSLKKCRYLTAIKLIEFLLDGAPQAVSDDDVEFVDGLNLWMLKRCDMVIVDDLDVGGSKTDRDAGRLATHLINPDQLRRAVTGLRGKAPLGWLGARRSVWVIGNSAEKDAWLEVIADLLGVSQRGVAIVHVGGRPAIAPAIKPHDF